MRNVSAFAIAATLGLGAWQAASAADLPVKAAPPAAVYAPISSWTGCYIGGNVGAAWGSGELSSPSGTVSGSSDHARFLGGSQIGGACAGAGRFRGGGRGGRGLRGGGLVVGRRNFVRVGGGEPERHRRERRVYRLLGN